MNFIENIRNAIGDNMEVVKFAFWNKEMAVYLWEEEIPISVFPFQESSYDNVVLDVEGYDWKLTAFQVEKIGVVMNILRESITEIRELTKDL